MFVAVCLGAGAFFLAHSVIAVVTDSLVDPVDHVDAVGPTEQPESDVRTPHRDNQELVRDILSSGLFLLPPSLQGADSRKAGSVAASAAPLNVSAKVSLIGVVSGMQNSARAIIEEVSSKKQEVYQVSQRIPDVGELVAIEKDRVLFREEAQEEWLELAIIKERDAMMPFPRMTQPETNGFPEPAVVVNPPGRRTVERAQFAALVSDPQAYLTEARFQPHFTGAGRLDGFTVDGIRRVGVLEKVGLQNEDILASVNGMEIRDPGKLWQLFQQMQHERTVRLNVIRRNQPVTLVVEIR